MPVRGCCAARAAPAKQSEEANEQDPLPSPLSCTVNLKGACLAVSMASAARRSCCDTASPFNDYDPKDCNQWTASVVQRPWAHRLALLESKGPLLGHRHHLQGHDSRCACPSCLPAPVKPRQRTCWLEKSKCALARSHCLGQHWQQQDLMFPGPAAACAAAQYCAWQQRPWIHGQLQRAHRCLRGASEARQDRQLSHSCPCN